MCIRDRYQRRVRDPIALLQSMIATVFVAALLVAVALAQDPPALEQCGPGTDRECCVNYCGVPDPYWDFILLPVTLDNLIEKFLFTRDIFQWLGSNLPEFSIIEDHSAELHIGRMAEFNRLFLEECLEAFCEKSATLYSQLVFDNAMPADSAAFRPASHLNGPLGA
eukprot:TRINITY_DN276_c0_g1_i2.p1 TRINITY_DN276_c0_g1~~TRINITY_DN276_c0_g1_i2.p1  ORF type:complete len:166 (+),score=67.47 TRINITY_DN276_c0_g1_i2:62-559(+)